MKYIPIVGIGLAIWGVVTLDWFKAGIGTLLFIGSFAIDLFKKKGVMADEKVFAIYKMVSSLVHIIRKSLEDTSADSSNPKGKLAQGLFFLGMVDAASQSSNMNDSQFIDLFKSVFTDLDHEFDSEYQSLILQFHQRIDTTHNAFPAIMKGGELFTKYAKGNTTIPLVAGNMIQELVADTNFPNSASELSISE
jgi:hypothetical protein